MFIFFTGMRERMVRQQETLVPAREVHPSHRPQGPPLLPRGLRDAGRVRARRGGGEGVPQKICAG